MATQARQLPDWEVGRLRYPWSKRIALFAGLVLPYLLLGAITSAFSGSDLLIGGGYSIVFALVFASLWWRTENRLVRRLGARPLDDPRFTNIVEGLAQRYGMAVPKLFVIDEGGPNAFVLHKGGGSVFVTNELLESYTRTEQEAVAAHCLTRLHSGHWFFSYLAALLGRTGSRFAPQVGFEDDVQAAAMTRYPPALASAIRKAKPIENSSAPLWFVAHSPSHRAPSERISALQDL
jgi:hypothetical protein